MTAPTRTVDLLAANPVFAALSREERLTLRQRGVLKRYQERERVLSEGDEPEHVYALVSGSVRVFHASPSGLEVVVKIFKPPSIFGEMEVITGLPFLENVAALEATELVLIPREVFLAVLQAHHGVTLALLRDVCARLCIASHNEKSLAFHDVRTRLANFLVCYAAFDGEQTPTGVRLRLRLTQDDMATALGVTRRAVAKEITRWQKGGVIERSGGRYLIRDLDRLSEEAAELHLAVTYAIGEELKTL